MFLDVIDDTGRRILINSKKILTIQFEVKDYPQSKLQERRIQFEMDGRIVYRIADTEENRNLLKNLDIAGGNRG